jgi:hypothetical protein
MENMTPFRLPRILLLAGILLGLLPLSLGAAPDLSGSWTIDRDASSAIDPWGRILLDINVDGKAVDISRTVTTGRRNSTQAYPIRIGKEVSVPVAWWTGNRHIGAYMGGDGTETLKAEWLDDGRTLRVESHYVLATSQGETPVRSYTEYRLSAGGDELTVIELRSSRNLPIVHVFKRS